MVTLNRKILVIALCAVIATATVVGVVFLNNQSLFGQEVTIKGSFSLVAVTDVIYGPAGNISLIANSIPLQNDLGASEIAIVAALYIDGTYKTASVSDGKFSISVQTHSPIGLAFLRQDESFVGYLSLGSGLSSIPLNLLAPGVTEIDLQTLTLSGSIITPSNNPIGKSIPLSAEELAVLIQSNSMFAAYIEQPDVDDNGVVDFLQDEFFDLHILYFISGGHFTQGNSQLTSIDETSIAGYKLSFGARTSNRPSFVTFSGPEGSGLSNLKDEGQPNVYDDRTDYYSPQIIQPSIPPAGQYVVTFNPTRSFTYSLADQSSAPSRIVTFNPSITLNGDGTINKVDWSYKVGSTTADLHVEKIIDKMEIQFDGNGIQTGIQQYRMYNSGEFAPTTTSHTLSSQNLEWSDVTDFRIVYDDFYGNHYVIGWQVVTP